MNLNILYDFLQCNFQFDCQYYLINDYMEIQGQKKYLFKKKNFKLYKFKFQVIKYWKNNGLFKKETVNFIQKRKKEEKLNYFSYALIFIVFAMLEPL